MPNWLKKLLRLAPPESVKVPTEFEVGIENNRLVIKFSQPVLRLELDRLQTLNLIETLTNKIVLTQKTKK